MIGLKSALTLILLAIYALLLIYFIHQIKKVEKCSFDNPCIRFCSENRNAKSDLDLLEHFKESDLLDYVSATRVNDGPWVKKYRNLSHCNVFRGQPECIDEENYSTDNYEFKVRLKFYFL